MKKSSALAMAIAGIVAAPVASAEVYVSARLGFEHVDTDFVDDDVEVPVLVDTSGGTSPSSATAAPAEELRFGNLSSRLGWRGETDLGNGMTAFGSLEVAADGFGLRQLHVGMSGDFGSVKVGENTYAAFYNHVTGPVDQPYWVFFPGLVENGRTGNVINYEGSVGEVRFGAAVAADGSDTSSTETQLAASFDIGDTLTLAAGITDNDAAAGEEVTGITAHGTAGDIAYAVTLQEDDDREGVQIWVSFGQFWVGYGTLEVDAGEPEVISAGYSAPIGRQTQWWIEVSSEDWDDIRDDETNVVAAIRYDYN